MLCFIFCCVFRGHCYFLSLFRMVDVNRLGPVLDEGKGERNGGAEGLAVGIIVILKFEVAFLKFLNC